MYESKKRNIFLSEYEVKPNPFIINDSLKIKVINAWVENQWAYGKSTTETIIVADNYQLVIEVESYSLNNYDLSWMIGVNSNRYIRSCGNNCLISDFKVLPHDVEEWQVQNGTELDSVSTKKIIGLFRVLKKI